MTDDGHSVAAANKELAKRSVEDVVNARNVPATGHSMKFGVLLFQRMQDGRIVAGHTYRDSLAALRQLGQITAPRD